MHGSQALVLLLAFAPLATPSQGGQEPKEASAQVDGPVLGQGVVAVGPESSLSQEALEELLIWRHGQAQSGQTAQRALLDLKALEHLAAERGVEVSLADLNARWAELESEVVASGQARDLPEFLAQNRVERETFRHYLKLGIAHERMVRNDLELGPDARVAGETQKVWLEEQMETLGYTPGLFPWADGVVATIGPMTVTRAELAAELRSKLPDADLADASYELLLEQRLLARMPDLAPEALDGAVDAEVERRRASVARNPAYQGAGYEQLLAAQGLSIEAVRRDPAVRAAALSHLWVDRTHDENALREVYASERPYFDGQFGAGALVYVCLLNAGEVKNDFIKRTFDEATDELRVLLKGVEDLATFQERVVPASDDRGTKAAEGLLGLVTRDRQSVPEPIRKRVFEVLDAQGGDVSGRILGPLRLPGGVVAVCLGERQPAPTWPEMAHKVHTELRRRHLAEVLPRRNVRTLYDPK